jgi:hypothetical protein
VSISVTDIDIPAWRDRLRDEHMFSPRNRTYPA